MPDRELPSAADPAVAREAFLAAAPTALAEFEWRQETPLSILVWFQAERDAQHVDRYVARFDFTYYPEWPPSVTFVDPETLKPAKSAWPKVKGLGHVAFYPEYGDAPTGMVCNSMFFEYYFWGGHGPAEATRWNPERHTFAASLNVIREALRAPFYDGPVS